MGDPCHDHWPGVACVQRNGQLHIAGLYLASNHLSGSLPSDLGLYLPFLTTL